MKKAVTRVVFIIFSIILASVVKQGSASTCYKTEGPCENCDKKCLAKYGPTVQTQCDGPPGKLQCTCIYPCGSPPKMCNAGAGLCSQSCPAGCCDTNCATKYSNGRGSCVTLGNFRLCQCQYPC